MPPAIETHELTVHFGNTPGILDLDLEVQEGEVFGFVGPNGAGKSTTIRLLLDLLRPDRGEVRLFGVEVRKGGGALRRRVGFLPGDLALFPFLSGKQTLDLFAGLSRRSPVLRDTVLEMLGFERDALGRKVRTYSTGMRQKIGIACAFQHDPELLILDEPTSGLDPVVRTEFLKLVREQSARGRTIFFSSHVLDEVQRCADRVGLVFRSRLELVESVKVLRERRPRMVVLRYADGRTARVASDQEPSDLLDSIDRNGLVDIEIRPPTLDEIFGGFTGAEVRP